MCVCVSIVVTPSRSIVSISDEQTNAAVNCHVNKHSVIWSSVCDAPLPSSRRRKMSSLTSSTSRAFAPSSSRTVARRQRRNERASSVVELRASNRWNPFVNVPNAPGIAMSDADRAVADASDGIFGKRDAMRSGRNAETLRRGVSRPDAYFADMGLAFEYGASADGRDMEQLNKLFSSVGFTRRPEGKLRKAIEHSHVCVWVTAQRDSRFAKTGEPVAFARATSDGVFTATVWDVAVAPQWQRHGIGLGIMERIVDRLLDEGITNLNLYAEKKVVPLYQQKLGFKENPDGTRAMTFRFDSRPYA